MHVHVPTPLPPAPLPPTRRQARIARCSRRASCARSCGEWRRFEPRDAPARTERARVLVTHTRNALACAASSVERTLDELHAAVLERIEDFLMRQPGDRPLAADDPEGEQFAASFLAGAEPLGAGVAASEAFGGGVG